MSSYRGRIAGGRVEIDAPGDGEEVPALVEGAPAIVVPLAGLEPHQGLRIEEVVETFWEWEDDEPMDADEFLQNLGAKPKERKAYTPTQFALWASDHQPPNHFQYGKAWWDFVESVQMLQSKFEIEDVRVVGQHMVKTPPPEESLPMPVVAFVTEHVTVTFKWDFGAVCRWPQEWTVSVERRSPYLGPLFGLIDPDFDARSVEVPGFPLELVLPPYRENPGRFTCELEDEHDFAMLLRMMLYEA